MNTFQWEAALIRLACVAEAAGEDALRAVTEATRLREPDYLHDCLAMGASLDNAVRWCEMGVSLEAANQIARIEGNVRVAVDIFAKYVTEQDVRPPEDLEFAGDVKAGLAECSPMTREALDQPQLTCEEVKDAILCKDETGRYVWRVVDNPGN